jgi:hypothetical protein
VRFWDEVGLEGYLGKLLWAGRMVGGLEVGESGGRYFGS